MGSIFLEDLSATYVIFLLFALVFFAYVIFTFVKSDKLTVKDMSLIAIMAALSVVLGELKVVPFPQGGGVTLCQFLPLMVLAAVSGRRNGFIGGIIAGILAMVFGGYILHPIQVMFDYIIPPMAISLIMINNDTSKKGLITKGLLAFVVLIASYTASGMVFYYAYCPEGMNLFNYVIVYELTGSGVDYIITLIVFMFIPLNTLKKTLNN